jgi:hypothetical protein
MLLHVQVGRGVVLSCSMLLCLAPCCPDECSIRCLGSWAVMPCCCMHEEEKQLVCRHLVRMQVCTAYVLRQQQVRMAAPFLQRNTA